MYDKFFQTPRPANKAIYKYLFSNELILIKDPENFTLSSYNKERQIQMNNLQQAKA